MGLMIRLCIRELCPNLGDDGLRRAAYRGELCWNLGDAVIRRRFVLACR